MRRWPSRIRGAGGSRTHSKLLCRQPPCRLAPAPRYPVSSPGVEPGPRPSQGRVQVPHTPRTFFLSALPRNRTSSGSFEDCCATPVHLQGKRLDQESNPGTDRRLVVDLRRVLCDPLHHRDPKRPDLESNQGQGLRRALCNPLHYRDMFLRSRADDWTCTSMTAVYKTAASLFGHVGLSQAGARGFEPRRAALEAASSPRRTLLNRPRPCGRGRWA